MKNLDKNDSREFVYFSIENNIKKCVNPVLHTIHHVELFVKNQVSNIKKYDV